jgi:hypothetical protein
MTTAPELARAPGAIDAIDAPDPELTPTRRTRTLQVSLALAGILVVAAILRVLGSRFGFPLLFHPDEWAVVDGAIDMAKRNSFEPPWSLRPDHVEMKLDYLVFAAYAALAKGMSVEAAFAIDPVPFYWLARLVTAAFGVATVFLAYLVGARYSRRAGIVAAVLFALFPAFVDHAHYATPDVPLTFAVMLLVYALMRYTVSSSWGTFLLSCFATALAVAIKYPGAVGAVMIGLVVTATAIRDRAWTRLAVHGAAAIGACLGFLFLISPTLFTNVSGIRRELGVQAAGGRLGHPDLGLVGNMRYYVETYVHFSGVVLGVLALVGLAAVVARRRLDVLPWFTGLLVWVSLSTLPMTWERWGLPMWTTPLLLASVGWCVLVDRLRTPRTRWIPWAVAAVVLVQLGAGAVRDVTSLMAPDTRAAALAYAEKNGIEERDTTFEGYTPFLPGDYGLFFKHVRQRPDGSYEFVTNEGQPAKYVMLSSLMYGRVLRDPKYDTESDIYRWLFDNGTELARFEPAAQSPDSWFEPASIWRNLRATKEFVSGEMTGPVQRIYQAP